MTRSTASASCSTIWSRRIAGTLRSPRRRSASSRWALAMAASPPLTATYMLRPPSCGCGWCAAGRRRRRARPGSGRRRAESAHGSASTARRNGAASATARWRRWSRCPGPCSDSTLGRRQAVDLQDQRRRAVRIFLRALREILERDQLGRARHQREHRVGRRVRRQARRCGRRDRSATAADACSAGSSHSGVS